jgi:hypothetical protein
VLLKLTIHGHFISLANLVFDKVNKRKGQAILMKVSLGFSVFNMYRTYFFFYVLFLKFKRFKLDKFVERWKTDSDSQTWLELELVKHLPSQGQKKSKIKKKSTRKLISHNGKS